MRDAIVPGESYISVMSLFGRIQRVVPDLIEQRRPGTQQTPVVSHTGVDFPIAISIR
jgi:hypothetical protein